MTRDELFEHYRLVVEEYRFQVELNWKRFQYFFVLTAALLAAGAALDGRSASSPLGIVAVHVAGALIAGLALAAGRTQRSYYQQTREAKGLLEHDLELGDRAPTPTPGQGSGHRKRPKVTTSLNLMMGALLVLHLVAAVLAAV